MAKYESLIDSLIADRIARLREQEAQAKQAKQRDLNVIESFRKNPNKYKYDEKMQIALAARSYGVPVADAARKDKPSAWKKALALSGGAVDSVLFGLLKDDWYTNDTTKGWSDVGKIGGTIASLLLPSGWFGAGKGALALGKMGMAATKGAKGLKTAKTIYDTTSKAKLAQAAARLAYGYANKDKFDPTFEDRLPDYADQQKLMEWYQRYYGNQATGMPGL